MFLAEINFLFEKLIKIWFYKFHYHAKLGVFWVWTDQYIYKFWDK